jgi:hypothetical protein
MGERFGVMARVQVNESRLVDRVETPPAARRAAYIRPRVRYGTSDPRVATRRRPPRRAHIP